MTEQLPRDEKFEQRKELVRLAEALESGQYKQGTGCLKTEDSCFCCLGVYVLINGINFIKRDNKWFPENSSFNETLQGLVSLSNKIGFDDTGALSEAGINLIRKLFNEKVPELKVGWCLSHLNDKYLNFSEIAFFLKEAAKSKEWCFRE